MIALTRLPAPSLATDCLVTFVERTPIDYEEALRQHALYRDALVAAGCRVVCLPPLEALPDSVFVEDVGLALPEGLVLCRPGAPERRPEVNALERDVRLSERRRPDSAGGPVRDPDESTERGEGRGGTAARGVPALPVLGRVEAGTVDGGDIVRLGGRLLVGRSGRTDAAGVSALAAVVEPLGLRVTEVPVDGALHLESICTAVDDATLLIDPARIDPAALPPAARLIEAHPEEPSGANVARAGGSLVASASAPRTVRRLEAAGCEVESVALSEFEKAEGAATCLSLRIG